MLHRYQSIGLRKRFVFSLSAEFLFKYASLLRQRELIVLHISTKSLLLSVQTEKTSFTGDKLKHRTLLLLLPLCCLKVCIVESKVTTVLFDRAVVTNYLTFIVTFSNVFSTECSKCVYIYSSICLKLIYCVSQSV